MLEEIGPYTYPSHKRLQSVELVLREFDGENYLERHICIDDLYEAFRAELLKEDTFALADHHHPTDQ